MPSRRVGAFSRDQELLEEYCQGEQEHPPYLRAPLPKAPEGGMGVGVGGSDLGARPLQPTWYFPGLLLHHQDER